jgi:hypothetical protein
MRVLFGDFPTERYEVIASFLIFALLSSGYVQLSVLPKFDGQVPF